MALDLSLFERFAKNYKAGDIVFSEYEPGEQFYLIQNGRVQITKIMGALEKTIDILQPGEFFGEMAILEEAPRSATAVCLDDCKLLEFNRANFEILMKGQPQIALQLLKLFSKRIYDQKRRFMILTLDDDEAKVADVFLMLSEGQPVEGWDDDGKRVFNTTVDGVAHWAGMTPAKAKEIVNHFVTQRRVELYQDKLVVKNINEFQRFVNSKRRNQEKKDENP